MKKDKTGTAKKEPYPNVVLCHAPTSWFAVNDALGAHIPFGSCVPPPNGMLQQSPGLHNTSLGIYFTCPASVPRCQIVCASYYV